ncbi:MAG: HAD-IA family hydrolase [Puniceicoccaceae bacterium]
MNKDIWRDCWLSLDAAGTLIGPNPSVGALYREALIPYGIEADEGEIEKGFRQAYERVGRTVGVGEARPYWRQIVDQALAPWLDQADGDAVFENLWNVFAKGSSWRLTDDFWLEALKALRGAGVGLVLSSNNDSRLRSVLREMDLQKFFDHLFISDEFGYEKPDPRFFRYVRNRLGVLPERLLHCGDDLRRDGGAKEDGWEFLPFRGRETIDLLLARYGARP